MLFLHFLQLSNIKNNNFCKRNFNWTQIQHSPFSVDTQEPQYHFFAYVFLFIYFPFYSKHSQTH